MQSVNTMNIKDEVKLILEELPDNCTLEDVQYHLYVAEKIRKGMHRADQEGTKTQEEMEKKYKQWTA